MSILHPLSQDAIRENFTHVGRMFGFVPVYIGEPDSEAPLVEVRNGWPDWLLDFGHGLFATLAIVYQWLDPYYEPAFWFTVTGEIEGASGNQEGASGD